MEDYDIIQRMEILAPTILEYWATRCILPHAHTCRVGMRLSRWKRGRLHSIIVVCGLAGALSSSLSPGTVLIPTRVGLTDGRYMDCDPVVVQALIAAAHSLHFQPDTGPLLTAPSLVVNGCRHYWSQRGFVAADMETGLLLGSGSRIAAIRVVLDNPAHDLSPAWLHPLHALCQPSHWKELFWLGQVAPCYALRAARVLLAALQSWPEVVSSR